MKRIWPGERRKAVGSALGSRPRALAVNVAEGDDGRGIGARAAGLTLSTGSACSKIKSVITGR